jgi:hypothetical protein
MNYSASEVHVYFNDFRHITGFGCRSPVNDYISASKYHITRRTSNFKGGKQGISNLSAHGCGVHNEKLNCVPLTRFMIFIKSCFFEAMA